MVPVTYVNLRKAPTGIAVHPFEQVAPTTTAQQFSNDSLPMSRLLKVATMPIPPTALPDAGTNHLERNDDALTEASPVLLLECGEGTQSFAETETGQSTRIKLSARDFLAALSRMRISISEISFGGAIPKDGGTYADIAVATLVKADGSGEERRTVAVKKFRFVLNNDMTEENFLRAFVNELLILDKLSHPNIVEIIGFVEDTESRIAWLVFPWEDNGNLRTFLGSWKWELPERVSLIQDVALGLEYLHSRQPPICHGDLKSLNILVNAEHRALITDFGSARITRETQEPRANTVPRPAPSASRVSPENNKGLQVNLTTSATTLTLTGPEYSFRWAPPEVLNGGPLDLASDIWALGWIAWEAITDSHPFEELNLESAVIMRIIEGNLPMLYDHGQLSQIHSLCRIMLSCWKSEPTGRPSAAECWRSLRWIPSIIPVSKRGKQSAIRSATLFLQLGEIHRLQNKHEEATKMYEQGLAIARSTGDQAAEARLSVQLADSHRVRCMYVEAEAAYARAMGIFGSIGNEQGRADAMRRLGDVQQTRSNYIDAEASYTQALVIFGGLDDPGRAHSLRGLGDVQQARSNYVDAEASYTQAMAIFGSIGDDLGRANTLRALGDVQLERSDYLDAEASYNQAMAIYLSIGEDLGRANALRGLGHVQRLRSNYIDAEASYTQAMAIFRNIGDDLGRANVLRGLGHVQLARSSDFDAEASFTQAMAIYASVGADLGRANTLIALGDVQQSRSNYVDAEASYNQAMVIYASIGNERGRADAFRGLGDIRQARSKHTGADAAYAQVMAICTSIGDEHDRAEASRGLGEIQQALSKYIDAEASYNQAMAIYASIGDEHGRADALRALGDLQQARSNYVDAEASYTQAIAIYASLGDHLSRAHSLLGLGLVQRTHSDYVEAEASCTQAMTVYEGMGNNPGRAHASLRLGEIQQVRFNYAEAEASYVQAMAIFRSIGDRLGLASSSLRLGKTRICQGRYMDAKTLINDAAEISEQINYPWGKETSKQLLKEVLEAERSCFKPPLPHSASPGVTHPGDIIAEPL